METMDNNFGERESGLRQGDASFRLTAIFEFLGERNRWGYDGGCSGRRGLCGNWIDFGGVLKWVQALKRKLNTITK